MSDIVREAGVGRSTFYDHYSSADDIHQQALAGPMTLLAESVLGLRTEQQMAGLLAHFREHRARARKTLSGSQGDNVERLLIAILEARLAGAVFPDPQSRRVAAIELAGVPLALIRAWLNDTVRGSSEEMARHIAEASAAIRRETLRGS